MERRSVAEAVIGALAHGGSAFGRERSPRAAERFEFGGDLLALELPERRLALAVLGVFSIEEHVAHTLSVARVGQCERSEVDEAETEEDVLDQRPAAGVF